MVKWMNSCSGQSPNLSRSVTNGLLIVLLWLAGPQASGQEAQPTAADAALRVITSGGFTAAYQELAPRFTARTGIEVETEYGASSGGAADSIPERLARGEYFDVIILSRPSLDTLTAQGYVMADSRTDLVRSRIGMAVREGAPLPDIGSLDKFRQVLLDAESIGYSASASGTYLSTELWPAMGIWPTIEAKSTRILSERVGAVVARGEVAIGFQQISELLPIEGIELVGPLPDAVQQITVFSAAITAQSSQPDRAQQLVDYLASAQVAPLIEQQGLDAIAR